VGRAGSPLTDMRGVPVVFGCRLVGRRKALGARICMARGRKNGQRNGRKRQTRARVHNAVRSIKCAQSGPAADCVRCACEQCASGRTCAHASPKPVETIGDRSGQTTARDWALFISIFIFIGGRPPGQTRANSRATSGELLLFAMIVDAFSSSPPKTVPARWWPRPSPADRQAGKPAPPEVRARAASGTRARRKQTHTRAQMAARHAGRAPSTLRPVSGGQASADEQPARRQIQLGPRAALHPRRPTGRVSARFVAPLEAALPGWRPTRFVRLELGRAGATTDATRASWSGRLFSSARAWGAAALRENSVRFAAAP